MKVINRIANNIYAIFFIFYEQKSVTKYYTYFIHSFLHSRNVNKSTTFSRQAYNFENGKCRLKNNDFGYIVYNCCVYIFHSKFCFYMLSIDFYPNLAEGVMYVMLLPRNRNIL